MATNRSKSSKPTNSCFEFPVDLLPQLLGRLPVKTLLQFRCVCKEWKSLIDSSDFVSLHSNLYNNNPQNSRLFLFESGDDRCLIRRRDTFSAIGQLDFPKDQGFLRPMSYANGFVVFGKSDAYYGEVVSFMVWNPSTRRTIEISYPSHSDSYFARHMKALLVGPPDGLVSSNNEEYSLVAIPCFHPLWKITRPSTLFIQVYSFSTGSWRAIPIPREHVYELQYGDRPVVLLNGAINWLGFNTSNEACVVAFDVQDCVVRCFRLPNGINGTLSVLHESLVLLDLEPPRTRFNVWPRRCFNVWVMESYGVDESPVHCVDVVTNEDTFLYLRRNGEVFLNTETEGVKVCDIESKRTEKLGTSYKGRILFMDSFVETLMVLPGSYNEPHV